MIIDKKNISSINNLNKIFTSIIGNIGYYYICNNTIYAIDRSQISPVVFIDTTNELFNIDKPIKIEYDKLNDFIKDHKKDITEIEIDNGYISIRTDFDLVKYEYILNDIDEYEFIKIKSKGDNIKSEILGLEQVIFDVPYIETDNDRFIFDITNNTMVETPNDKSITFITPKKSLVKTIKSSKDAMFNLYHVSENVYYLVYSVTNTKFKADQIFKIINL